MRDVEESPSPALLTRSDGTVTQKGIVDTQKRGGEQSTVLSLTCYFVYFSGVCAEKESVSSCKVAGLMGC